jgi:hypothetical protein
VWYPLHPLYRKHDLSVVRTFGCRDLQYLELRGPEIRKAVCGWMVDPDLCGQMTCGLLPTADLPSLLELARWLREQAIAGLSWESR